MAKDIFTLKDIATLRRLDMKRNQPNFKEYYDKATDMVRQQFDSGDYREYKVQLISPENDSYVEIWQVVGEKRWFARYTCGRPEWFSVCDPFGYAELDSPIKNNVMFVICSDEGKPMFGTSNLFGALFPTFEEMCHQEWNKIKADYPHFNYNEETDFWSQYLGSGTTIAADQWLLTFKDPDIYGKVAKDYDENWCFHTSIVNDQAISSFDYLGSHYGIFKVTYEHRDCKKQITEYWVGTFKDDSEHMEQDNMLVFLDSHFEGEPGTMYLEREAIQIVAEGLKEIYGNEQISMIRSSYGYVYEQFFKYSQAAKHLLNGDYHRKNVTAVLKKEKETHTFWKVSDERIDELYPTCVRDHSGNYDFMGRRIA